MTISKAFFWSSNDKTICKFDHLTREMHSGTKYSENTFQIRTRDGDEITEKGLYLICDGGFCKWRILMTGFKYCSSLDEAHWSAQMESTRKDVERAFGILKGRFRALKLPILLHNKETVDYMFTTCVMLHNMILTADGRDNLWERDVDWAGGDGDHYTEDDDWNFSETNKRILFRRAMRKLTDYSAVGRRFYVNPSEAREEDSENTFYDLRRKLVNHYYYLSNYEPSKIEWLN